MTTRPEVTGRRRPRAATIAAPPPARGPSDSLADDLLRGATEIAAFLGQPERITYHQLLNGFLPATKVGATWIGSKTRLRAHFQGDGVR